jgi:UDP-N-acetylmuramate: L-alanyl-gamma-D-glutamyl-meso-diaminopimelate ligase
MHYRPQRAIVTSLEFDHADIFENKADYRNAFEDFVGLLPSDGLLALCGDHPAVRALAPHANATVRTYGLEAENDVRATDLSSTAEGTRFTMTLGDTETDVGLPLHGRHNVQNALAAATLAHAEGLSPTQIAEGLASFAGMKRRQEVRGEPNGILVLDDFAHHPTAVEATLQAVRTAHPNRRLVAVFEPRSNSSRRKLFETAYGEAFDAADAVFLKAPPVRHNDDADAMLDPDAVVGTIRERGVPAQAFAEVDALLPVLSDALRPGDVALLMSNGSFDGLHERLLEALSE